MAANRCNNIRRMHPNEDGRCVERFYLRLSRTEQKQSGGFDESNATRKQALPLAQFIGKTIQKNMFLPLGPGLTGGVTPKCIGIWVTLGSLFGPLWSNVGIAFEITSGATLGQCGDLFHTFRKGEADLGCGNMK